MSGSPTHIAGAPRPAFAFLSSGRTIHVVLALYLAMFVLFRPQAVLVDDEVDYVGQAVVFATGHIAADQTDPSTGAVVRKPVGTYPPGNSLLIAPFIWIAGPGWASAASCLAMVAFVEFIRRLLVAAGGPQICALLALLFPASLVLGRTAMSDLPAAAMVTLALLLFWIGSRRSPVYYFSSGALAGLSLLFRETSTLVLIPFFAGAVLRRERRALYLIAGGLLGCVPRFIAARILYGNATFARANESWFSVAYVPAHFLFYVAVLMVIVPGGLAVVAAYRGARRFEMVSAVAIPLVFFSLYGYSGAESGFFRRMILGSRFMMPLLPVFALAWGETGPRLWRRLSSRTSLKTTYERWLGLTLVVAVVAMVVLVHPALWWWSRSYASIVAAIRQHTKEGSTIVIDPVNTRKMLLSLTGTRTIRLRDSVPPHSLGALEPKPVQVVFVDRADSEVRRQNIESNRQYAATLASACNLTPTHDEQYSTGERLRIWSVSGCAPSAQ